MDFEKLTNRSKELFQDVVNLAAREKHQFISPEHLLSVMLNSKDSTLKELLQKAGTDVARLSNEVDAALKKIPAVSGESVQSVMSQEFTRVMMEAEKLADKAGDSYVTQERILQALAQTAGTKAYDLLKEARLLSPKLMIC